MKQTRAGIMSFFFLFQFSSTPAQVNFKTIVPQHPIAPGESFQVQYIIENAEKVSDFSPPPFRGFRLVAGPHMYSGDGPVVQKNLVFTLAAIREGNFKIPGATCLADGKLEKSNEVVVKVISQREMDETSYFLKQGEDPFQKIRENLFLKLSIDKSTCLVGEPLVATFKLYSRLQSKSNIIKNPGFYGFSVYDMINVNDQAQSEEKLNGHWFDVHTVLKVQLYPLQSGTFTIDPMELANEVEFSRSIVNKKTEQEVTENMYGVKTDDDKDKNAEVYKLNIKTNPVAVKVRPLPVKNAADTFAGAVGSFSIKAFVEKDSVSKNEEDSLIITISGAGNFQRVGAPLINWPKDIEFFEPSARDTLNKQRVPLTGERRFRYIFLSNKSGQYTIPPVSFSFFDLGTKSYKTVVSKALTVFIKEKIKKERPLAVPEAVDQGNTLKWWWTVASLAALLIGIFVLVRRRQTKPNEYEDLTNLDVSAKMPPTVEEILLPADSALNEENRIFYRELDRSIGNYFKDRFPGSINMSKTDLVAILNRKAVKPELIGKLTAIIHQCETGVYANAEIIVNKSELLEKTIAILNSIDKDVVG
jgi:oxygen tolerance protein BatD